MANETAKAPEETLDVVNAAVRDLLDARARLAAAKQAQEEAASRVSTALREAHEAEARVKELLEIEDDR